MKMEPLAWIRHYGEEDDALGWDKPYPSDCANSTPLYHGGQVDARIAELTADLKVADRAALELAAEVARYKDDADTYREALNDIAGWGQTSFGVGPLVEQMRNRARSAISVARNALKEGL